MIEIKNCAYVVPNGKEGVWKDLLRQIDKINQEYNRMADNYIETIESERHCDYMIKVNTYECMKAKDKIIKKYSRHFGSYPQCKRMVEDYYRTLK